MSADGGRQSRWEEARPQAPPLATEEPELAHIGGLHLDRGSVPPVDPGMSPARRSRQWRLRSLERSVPSIRQGFRDFLDDTGLPADEIQDLILAACEAVTNAVEHAQHPTEPFVDVSAVIDAGVVTIVVHDHGGWRQPQLSPFRGRGLAMMHVLADTTVNPRRGGSTVTMRNLTAAGQATSEDEEELA
jgi:anti-sigma regulatory factor (Ser/Thr protein kinase)